MTDGLFFPAIRVAVYVITLAIAVFAMAKASYSPIARRLVAAAAIAAVFFNYDVSRAVYVAAAAVLQTAALIVGFGFLLVMGVTVIVSPILYVIYKFIHGGKIR